MHVSHSLQSCHEQEQFARCGQTFRYRKLLFALAWFHAILLERRKFKSLGFNVPYEFNESDFSICHDLVIVFLDEVRAKTTIKQACLPARRFKWCLRSVIVQNTSDQTCLVTKECGSYTRSATILFFIPGLNDSIPRGRRKVFSLVTNPAFLFARLDPPRPAPSVP